MAAYRKDINLFKAAGGERAKSKKMAAGKKLAIVAVAVLIVVVGAVVGLSFYKKTVTDQLAKLQKQESNYNDTNRAVRNMVEQYRNLQMQSNTALAIEYRSMLQAGFSTDLSQAELKALREFLEQETVGFSIENNFDDVIDEVMKQLNLSQYPEDGGEVDADLLYNNKFLYGALGYMKAMQDVFSYLPMQHVDTDQSYNYWYCYYRGKLLMLLRSTGGNAEALAVQLQDPETLQCDPFCSLQPTASSVGLEGDFAQYATVTLEGETYVAIAVTMKTVPERFMDIVEDTIAQQDDNIKYNYAINSYSFDANNSIWTVSLYIDQSENFNMTTVCSAVDASPFFVGRSEYAFGDTDSVEGVEKELQFDVTSEAVNATYDSAISYFVIEETEE